MSSYLSMMETRLPPGFRFHPRDEELICDYLAKKVFGDNNRNESCSVYGCPTMIDVDLNKCEPWDLPETARVGSKEWYFFSLRDRKYATGQRTNRATMSGYWKATGKDRHITRTGVLVGMRKTLVFYQGRAPKGRKTDWVMHEFRLESSGDESKLNSVKEDWVLCRVFNKSRGNSSSSFKPNMETTSSYEDMISSTSSHSLPPLMDQTYITFGGQTSLSFEGYDEQVPCFSNPTFQISSSLSGPPMAGPSPAGAVHRSTAPMTSANPDHLGSGLKQLDCEKKVIRAVLNHLTKLEGDPNLSLGEGSIDSYLCENNGFSPMW